MRKRAKCCCTLLERKLSFSKIKLFKRRKDIRQEYLQWDHSSKALSEHYIALKCRHTVRTTSAPFSILDCPLPGREGRAYSSLDEDFKRYILVSFSDMMSHPPPRLLSNEKSVTYCYRKFCYLFDAGQVIFFKDWPLVNSGVDIVRKEAYEQARNNALPLPSKQPFETVVSLKDYSIDVRSRNLGELLKPLATKMLHWIARWRVKRTFDIAHPFNEAEVIGMMYTQVPEVEHFEATTRQAFTLSLMNRAPTARSPAFLSISSSETPFTLSTILRCSEEIIKNEMRAIGKFNRILYGKDKCTLGAAMEQGATLVLKGFDLGQPTVSPQTESIYL